MRLILLSEATPKSLYCESLGSIRLFRNPTNYIDNDKLIREAENGTLEGRYFTTRPDYAIGYYPTGQLIEVNIPISEVAPENHYIAMNLVFDDQEPTDSVIKTGVDEATKLGVPKSLIDKIIYYTKNKKDILKTTDRSEIIRTVDGTITKDMARLLKQIFPYYNTKEETQERKGTQVQLLTRNITSGELIAIYEYTENPYTITKVTKVNGTPTLKQGQVVK